MAIQLRDGKVWSMERDDKVKQIKKGKRGYILWINEERRVIISSPVTDMRGYAARRF